MVDGELSSESSDLRDYLITLSFGDSEFSYNNLLTQILLEGSLEGKPLKILGVTNTNECIYYYNSDIQSKIYLCNADSLKYISIKIGSVSLNTLTEVLTNITKKFTELNYIKVVALTNYQTNCSSYTIGMLDYFCRDKVSLA